MSLDRRRAHVIAAALAAASLLLTSCSSGSGEATDPAAEQSTVTVTPTPTPQTPTDAASPSDDSDEADTTESPAADLPAFPTSTEPQEAEPTGWELVLQQVRVAKHDGFDRMVLEFSGDGLPGWRVNYVDTPRQDGSGTTVKLAGDSWLDVYAAGTAYPAEDGPYYDGPKQFQPDADEIEDVFVGGTFEGYTQVLLGIDDKRAPFRVFALTKPSRLVVDVKTD